MFLKECRDWESAAGEWLLDWAELGDMFHLEEWRAGEGGREGGRGRGREGGREGRGKEEDRKMEARQKGREDGEGEKEEEGRADWESDIYPLTGWVWSILLQGE